MKDLFTIWPVWRRHIDGWQIKGKNQHKVSWQNRLIVPLHWFYKCVNSTQPMNTVLPKYIPSFGVLMMVMESTVWQIGPKSSIQLGWDVVNVKAITCYSHHFHTYQTLMSFGWGHGHPGIDHSHKDRNVSSQDKGDHSEEIYIALQWPYSLRGTSGLKPCQQNAPHCKHSDLYWFFL